MTDSTRRYYLKNREIIDIKRKENYHKNKEKYLRYFKMKRLAHKEIYNQNKREYQRLYTKINWCRVKKYQEKWRKENPEKLLKNNFKYLTKFGKVHNFDLFETIMALMTWSKIIHKRDKLCVICGSRENLNAHHILHKKLYPTLAFNTNNGITLCQKHHKEVHGKCLYIRYSTYNQ